MKTYNIKQVRFEASFEQLPDDDTYTEDQPRFGLTDSEAHSVLHYTDWFYDNDDQSYEYCN
jgi:hypothetical protein